MPRLAGTVLLALVCAAACALTQGALPQQDDAADPKQPSLLSTLSYYEVVEIRSETHSMRAPPSNLHLQSADAWTTSAVPTHPLEHTLSFCAHSLDFDLQLTKNLGLFAKSYSESRQYWSEGVRRRDLEPPVRELKDVEQCFYQGGLVPTTDATIRVTSAVNTCNYGFSGIVARSMETFVIEPAHKHLTSAQLSVRAQSLRLQSADGAADVNPYALHVVYKLSDTREFKEMYVSGMGCGVGNSDVPGSIATATMHTQDHDSQYNLFKAHFGVFNDDAADEPAQPQQQQQKSFQSQSTSSYPSAGIKFSHRTKSTIPAARYVELFVANDVRRYTALGQTTETITGSIVNQMDIWYKATAFTPTTLSVTLVGQTTFFKSDPWTITTGGCTATSSAAEVCVDTLLTTWNEWRRNPDNTSPYDFNDAGHLFSGYDFQDSVLGYAGVGAMCTTAQSGGIEQMTSSVEAFNAAVSTHELGHNLGMQHDAGETGCPTSGYIMNAVVNSADPPTTFSPCSIAYYATWANGGSGSCMDNEPSTRWSDAPVCGNGYVESGETCDCGPYDINTVAADYCATNSTNSCCDALSCQFAVGAVCSETDVCCTGCQLTPASAALTCRNSTGVCDLPEICDGTSNVCPFNDHVGNGEACTLSPYGASVCYEGVCTSYSRQCREVGNLVGTAAYLTCNLQSTLNADAGLGYCGNLYCTLDQSSSGCVSFNLSSAGTEPMGDGNPCGATDATTGLPGNDYVCLGGSCVATVSTNTRFQWSGTDWTTCAACSTIQYRNVSCIHVASGSTVASDLCTASAIISTSQSCSNEELLCSSSVGGSIKMYVMGRNIEINSNLVIGVTLGIFFVLLGILGVCVACVRKKESDRPHQALQIGPQGAIVGQAGHHQPAASPSRKSQTFNQI